MPNLELLPILHCTQQGMKIPLLLFPTPVLATFNTFIRFNHADIYCGPGLDFCNVRIPRNRKETKKEKEMKIHHVSSKVK